MKSKQGKLAKPGLEMQYDAIFKIVKPGMVGEENESLEQPSPYTVVETITTYGAYEDLV